MIIGALGSLARAVVTAGGVVDLPQGITVQWWVGAEDRWHLPAEEITVRQSLVSDAPVARIALRVPGGDIVGTVAAVQQGQRELVVVDVANQSAVPVAIAFVISGSRMREVTIDGSVIRVAGRPVLYLPRVPQFTVGAPTQTALLDALRAGESGPVSSDAAFVAAMLPLTHRTTLRAAGLLSATGSAALMASPVLSALPDAETVGRGWGIHMGRGPSVDGQNGLDATLRSLTGALLLQADAWSPESSDVDVLRLSALGRACARMGLFPEAERVLGGLDDLQGLRGSLGPSDQPFVSALAVSAIVDHALLSQNMTFAASMAPVVAGALEFMQKRTSEGRAVFGAAARFFARIDEPGAARAVSREWVKSGSPWPLPRAPLPPLPAMSSGGSLLPDDLVRLTDQCLDAVGPLGAEGPTGTVALLNSLRADDLVGVNLAVHRVPTVGGLLSYAIRWHGERPALLWEFSTGEGTALSVPSLSGMDVPAAARGEVLLTAPRS